MSTVTININDFSNPQFNPKSWINSVLKPSTITTSSGDDDAAKDTTILVTKLQIISESTSRQFDQLSTSVMTSMPRILYDLKVISENATSTHRGVESVKKNLGVVEGTAALQGLRRPHIAKTRMEQCQVLLTEKANELEEQRKAKEALDTLMRQEAEKEQEERRRKSIQAAEEESFKREQEEERAQTAAAAAAEEEEKRVESIVLEEEMEQKLEPPVFDEGLEYGHVQLPPLRTTQLPKRVQTPTITSSSAQEDNSYLQQIQDSMTPQVSNVFKRIGVPVMYYVIVICLSNITNLFFI
jgi:flagellar biosynthesis GTPase FlhF